MEVLGIDFERGYRLRKNYKLKKLESFLLKKGRVIVAFSGGVDSTFLLFFARNILGRKNVTAVTAISPIHHLEDIKESKKIARRLGVKHLIIKSNELADRRFCANTIKRCYYCKDMIYSKMREMARRLDIDTILDGTTKSDKEDFRPGVRAASKWKIDHPLLVAGINKDEIRKWCMHFSKAIARKPSQSCLATRIPYGSRITRDKINRIQKAEDFLKSLGFQKCRVREYDGMSRIELDPKEIRKIFVERKTKKIVDKFNKIGYIYITLDLAGYRSGSMNEIVRMKKSS